MISNQTKKGLKALFLSAIFLFSLSMKAEQLTATFEKELPEGWTKVGLLDYYNESRAYQNKGYGIGSEYKSYKTNYIITTPIEGDISFYARSYNTKTSGVVTFYKVNDDNSLGDEIYHFTTPNVSSSPISFQKYNYTLEIPQRIAIDLYYVCIDNLTYTPAVLSDGPELMVQGYENGSSYNFGGIPVAEGTTVSFTLANAGTADLNIESIEVTGGFNITEGDDAPKTLAPQATAIITVATPAQNAEGTLVIKSDDEASPYEIHLSSLYKAPAPVLGFSPKSIDFGKVTETVSEEITVSNTGDADLTVTLTSSSEFFTVSPSELTVAPDASDTFTVTFLFNEKSYGQQNATITLASNAGDPEEIACSVFAKDPTIWEEDFEGGKMPEHWTTTGWVVQKHYQGNKTYMAYAGTNTNPPTITTPRLSAKKGDVIQFETSSNDNSDPLTVEYSSDRENWTPIEGSPLTQEGQQSFTAPEDGYYYLRFQGRYAAIDNFFGFRLALKEHDIAITRSDIPAEAHQYLEYTATVTLMEMMGQEESAEVLLILDGETVASDTATLDAESEKTITLSFTPVTPTENSTLRVQVNYAEGETVLSEPVTFAVNEAPVWGESDFEGEFDSQNYPVVVLDYTVQPGWNTITVPFRLSDEHLTAIFGSDYEIYELKEYDNTAAEIRFKVPGFYAAGYPYLVYVTEPEATRKMAAEAETPGILLKNVKIENGTAQSETRNGVTFNGTYTPFTASATDNAYEIASQDKTLTPIEEGSSLDGFRGYITLPEGMSKLPAIVCYDQDGVPTRVTTITDNSNPYENSIFNLNGIRVNSPSAPGIYIINGKKVIIGK